MDKGNIINTLCDSSNSFLHNVTNFGCYSLAVLYCSLFIIISRIENFYVYYLFVFSSVNFFSIGLPTFLVFVIFFYLSYLFEIVFHKLMQYKHFSQVVFLFSLCWYFSIIFLKFYIN